MNSGKTMLKITRCLYCMLLNNTVFVLHAFVFPLLFYDAAGRSRQSIDRDPRCLSGGFDVSRYQDPAAEQL